MILKFPKKKIVLECFTHNAAVYQFFPIALARQHVPQWFKQIPQTTTAINNVGVEHPQPTFRRCDGFINLFNSGWALPLWCDMIIETEEDGGWKYHVSDNIKDPVHIHAEPVTMFGDNQLGNNFPNHCHVKIDVPWFIREKTGVYFHYTQNTWGTKEHWDNLTVVPGLLNFKDQGGGHINMFVKRGIRIMIEHNTSLIHCVPLSEAKLEIKNYLVSEQEFKHLKQPSSFSFSFVGRYKKGIQLEK